MVLRPARWCPPGGGFTEPEARRFAAAVVALADLLAAS